MDNNHSPREQIEARAVVMARIRPLPVDGRVLHQIGIPIHGGYSGESVGDPANDLTALLTEPNVSMHEGKPFVCDLRPGRLNRSFRAAVPWSQRRPKCPQGRCS
jgi:formate dehydrogenase major subunit